MTPLGFKPCTNGIVAGVLQEELSGRVTLRNLLLNRSDLYLRLHSLVMQTSTTSVPSGEYGGIFHI